VYMCCTAEVIGKIAFSGGAYGLSRVTLGFFWGFIVGYMELLEYVAYTAVSVVFIANFICDCLGINPYFEPLIWLLFYILAILLFHKGGKFMWNFIVIFSIPCLIPIILYCFGVVKYTNFPEYGALRNENNENPIYFSGNLATGFINILPYTTWAYGGIESLALVTNMATDPQKTIPKGILASVISLFVSNIALVCIVSSMPPGLNEIIAADYPLNYGYQLVYGMSDMTSSLLMLPAQIGMALGFMLPYGRLTQSLAESNLVPKWCGLKNEPSITKSIIVPSVGGYILCIISFLSSDFEETMQNLCILAACISYLAQIAGFVMLRTTLKTETKGFKSPFGIPGAVFSSFMYFLLSISIIGGFQGDQCIAFASVSVVIVLISLYYHLGCKKYQKLSKEEQGVLFRFSIIKFNKSKGKKSTKAKSAHTGKSANKSMKQFNSTNSNACSAKYASSKVLSTG